MSLTVGSNYAVDLASSSPKSANLGTKMVLTYITFDSSYPTGGEALTTAQLGLEEVLAVIFPCSAGYSFAYDETNQKVLAYWVDTTTDGAALAQVENTTNLSAVSVWALAFGR
jgi:hypothetical protein